MLAAFLARSSWSVPTATGAFGVLLWVLVILAIIALLAFLLGRWRP